MPNNFRARNQLLLVKVQAAKGTAETPTVSANAVKAYFPIPWGKKFESIDTDYAQEGLDQSEHIVGGGFINPRPRCNLKGSGTGGTAPDYGPLLRGCAMSQTLVAADVTGQAQAGAASTITLAAGASAVDDAYKGMPIRITGDTGAGQVNLIKSYNGTTKVATVAVAWTVQPDATSDYSIDAGALYRPVSVATEVITLWKLQHHSDGSSASLRDRAYDGAGNLRIALRPGKIASLEFDIRARLVAKTDDFAFPGAATFQSQQPEPLLGAQAYLGGAAIKFSDIAFDLGAGAEMFPDPSDTYGMDTADVIGRQSTGSIALNRVSIATRDAMTDWLAGTKKDLWVRWGSAAGKRISLYWPEIKYTGQEDVDVSGYAGESLPFRAPAMNGSVWLYVH